MDAFDETYKQNMPNCRKNALILYCWIFVIFLKFLEQ